MGCNLSLKNWIYEFVPLVLISLRILQYIYHSNLPVLFPHQKEKYQALFKRTYFSSLFNTLLLKFNVPTSKAWILKTQTIKHFQDENLQISFIQKKLWFGVYENIKYFYIDRLMLNSNKKLNYILKIQSNICNALK